MARIYFAWDDGHPDDFRLKRLHEKYEIPCILFIPALNCEGRNVVGKQEIKNLRSEIVQIGAHTFSHIYLNGLTEDVIRFELSEGRKYLENILGERIPHFCFPGGTFDSVALKRALATYETVRTAETMCTTHPYPIINTTFHFYPRGRKSILYNSLKNSPSLFLRSLARLWGESYFEFIQSTLRYSFDVHKGWDIVIWGHSWEISQVGLWNELEDLFDFIHENGYQCCKYGGHDISEVSQ